MQVSMNNGYSHPNQAPNFKKARFGDLIVQTQEKPAFRAELDNALQKAGVAGYSTKDYPAHSHKKGGDELMIRVHTNQNNQAMHAILADKEANKPGRILNIYSS